MYGCTDVWMCGHADGISPHSTGLHPLSGPLPKKPRLQMKDETNGLTSHFMVLLQSENVKQGSLNHKKT